MKKSQVYDLVYRWKDYEKESNLIQQLIQEHVPGCQSILDVGCGSGQHDMLLSQHYQVDGIDTDADALEAARDKNPAGTYYQGNMAKFDVGKTYDAIICMFSAIGYLLSKEKVIAALECFRRHLNPGGVIIVEPWLTPQEWQGSRVDMFTYEDDNVKICRMNKSTNEGNLSILHFHYLVGTKEEGVEHYEEIHKLLLLSVDEMVAAFKAVQLKVELLHPEELSTKRGVYVAKAD